jgi:hypothetical protein
MRRNPMKTTIMTKKTGTTRGFVAGYPTKIGRKVFDTGYSVTYEAENEEFGKGLVTIMGGFLSTFVNSFGMFRFTPIMG